jgi:DNA-binding transcriptional LysR family regulator
MLFDLIDLTLFVNIAESNSLTRGAERSHMSLPAASTRIKNVEDRLGIKLLYRKSRGVALTPAGHAFLTHGRLMLQQLERLQGDLQEYTKGVKGHLRILANTTAITEFLPRILSKYLVTHPDVNVDLREGLSLDIVRAVAEGTTDVGVVAGNVNTIGLKVLPYRQDRLVIAAALGHPLAKHKSIPFRQTMMYDYVTLSEGTAIHSFLNEAASHLGQTLKTRIQVGNFEALCRMVEMNVGIGVLSETAARRYAKTMNIKIVRIQDEWAVRNLQICVRGLEALPTFARELIELFVAEHRTETE